MWHGTIKYQPHSKQNVNEHRTIRKFCSCLMFKNIKLSSKRVTKQTLIVSPCYQRRYHDFGKHYALLYNVQSAEGCSTSSVFQHLPACIVKKAIHKS